MDPALYDLVVSRLVAAGPSSPAAEGIVLAACDGRDALDAVLSGATPPRSAATVPAAPPAAGVHLASIGVEGFRGVGERATLMLAPYPSLTLVVGRNGSGKSSFAEGLELLLTGSNRRWEGRSEIWRDGWRNLHHGTTQLTADFVVEGRPGRTTIVREWPPETDLARGSTLVDGRADDGRLAPLGWAPALAAYRPFLPHNELGALWDEGPTKLHDALAAILGLDDLTVLMKDIADARLGREQRGRQVTAALAQVRALLEQVDDERARAFVTATARRGWDLDRLGRILEGDDQGRDGSAVGELSLLRALASIGAPPVATARDAARRLRAAARAVVGVEATDAGRARSTAALLAAALEHVRAHGDDACPVCRTPGAVNPLWRSTTEVEIERLRRLAQAADEAHAAATRERHLATALLGTMPAVVRDGAGAGVDTTALIEAWRGWLSVDVDAPLETLADHLDGAIEPLALATAAVRNAAAALVAQRDDAWRPAAGAARAWLDSARAAQADAGAVAALKEAETWVKREEMLLREERFAPIAAAVQANWTTLRQDSSVALGGLRLEGARRSPSRRVALDVSIDGAGGQALGVMSQGELNALALSLFLPRASLPESPFRFVVIDDPVQAMDPNRVDGLARVLERASSTHQVVVFTHDERLPAAVRRLGIEATVVEVVRREGSVVELRESLDPVRRHIDDAFAVANADHLPIDARRVVPTFCRLALEAACVDVVVRRRLARGARLTEVEAELERSTRLTTHLALALFDDATRGNDVAPRLISSWGAWAQGVYSRCNRGAHGADEGDLAVLCRDAERLAERIHALR